MNCPVCKIKLKIAERQGIEIDYCPQCRGVWLDRGELDKMIERSTSSDIEYKASGIEYKEGHRKRNRENSLKEIFDFF